MKKALLSLTIILVITLSFMLQACDKGLQKPISSKTMISGKAKAPVSISSELIGSQLSVDITFLSDVDGLNVGFIGLDGLQVVDQTPSSTETTFISGDVLNYILNIEQPSGMSYVSIEISGNFNGVKRVSVQAVPIGKITDVQANKRSDGIKSEAGESLHILPADLN